MARVRWAGLKVGDRGGDFVVTRLWDDPACDEDIVQIRHDDGCVASWPASKVAWWMEMTQKGGEAIPDLVERMRSEREALSLRDEAMAAARMFRYRQQTGYGASPGNIDYAMADDILAVVRRHVAALTFNAGTAYLQAVNDVLRLLDGE